MPLLKCPDCGGQVSSQAESCPHCARPIRGKQPPPDAGDVQTIEQTGKLYKGMQLIGAIGLITGLVMWMGADTGSGRAMGGFITSGVSFVAVVIARMCAWWEHG